MEWTVKAKEFWTESIRVMRVTKKPDKEEFMMIVKVAGAGILIIGLIGFVFTMIRELIRGI